MKHEKSCGAIVYRVDKNSGSRQYLLVLQGISKVWGFPKGHVDKDETEYETASREVFEETGLKIEFVDRFRVSLSYKPKPDIHKNVVFFLAKALTEEIKIDSNEILGYAWLNFNDALKRITFNNSKALLHKAETFIEKSTSNSPQYHRSAHKD
ncbi:MAG: bis(5'-nucleosyl)-tetraphosphatase [Candidatus Woesearchaeota archaeon]